MKEWDNASPLYPELPIRKWIRENIPRGQEGYNIEDLDLIILRFGNAIGRDYGADGEFILCECKENKPLLPYKQKRTFQLLDRLLKEADPQEKHYKGFYLVCWDGKREVVQVNSDIINQKEFVLFLKGKLQLKPYNFGR